MHVPRAQTVRHASPEGSWELVLGAPDPRLRRYVLDTYIGYHEQAPGPVRRRELPSPKAVLIFDFGPPLRILDSRAPDDPGRAARHEPGFAAGLDDTFSITETPGVMSGLQVYFTPIGARLFFGMPMRLLARRVVGLGDVLGVEGLRLRERLLHTPSWEARFALLDHFILRRIHEARAISDCVTWAWQRILASGGGVEIGALADELGYSQKHLITLFNEDLGLPPKLLARLVRFDRVIQALKTSAGRSWASLALEHGYFDQAHLIRDFRQFTGSPPGEYLRRQLPGMGGTRGD
ncbi:AraC family transcriptional regulator [Pyxidicoccus fallax]|uniref:AraC family transcriptional regulator n=1 Tax=Pyxidicoccus fallax TaxID=394095 RepID=A0A848L844_9BACT|nr:helix-turn-helix domain-containing protein [Pyxidicoccus fallax]NMO14784.1 AraC family transcriptional regulator [Pyxidicoccus fallax]NPC79978.1 AraC family transcriptional regulator [Pyxidicoccus fallax]